MTAQEIITRLMQANENLLATLDADAVEQSPESFRRWRFFNTQLHHALNMVFVAQPMLLESVKTAWAAYDAQVKTYTTVGDNLTALKDAATTLTAKIVWQQLHHAKAVQS